MMPLVVRAVVLVVAGALFGLGGNALRPHGIHVVSWSPPTQCTGAEGAAAPTVMSPREAASLCGQPDVVIADTRSAAAFAEGHVAGAVHLPCSAGGPTASEALGHFTRAQTILVYGTSTAEARPVAETLQQRHPGVRVAILDGGFAAWESAGLACASGPCNECKVANP